MFFVLQLLCGIEWFRSGDKVQGDYNLEIIIAKKVYRRHNRIYLMLYEIFQNSFLHIVNYHLK